MNVFSCEIVFFRFATTRKSFRERPRLTWYFFETRRRRPYCLKYVRILKHVFPNVKTVETSEIVDRFSYFDRTVLTVNRLMGRFASFRYIPSIGHGQRRFLWRKSRDAPYGRIPTYLPFYRVPRGEPRTVVRGHLSLVRLFPRPSSPAVLVARDKSETDGMRASSDRTAPHGSGGPSIP